MNLQKPKAPYSQIIRNFCSRAELTEGLRKLYRKITDNSRLNQEAFTNKSLRYFYLRGTRCGLFLTQFKNIKRFKYQIMYF